MSIHPRRSENAADAYRKMKYQPATVLDAVEHILTADDALRIERPELFTSTTSTNAAMNEKQEDGKQDKEPKLPDGIKFKDIDADGNRMRYVTRTGFCIPLLTQSELRAIADHMDWRERQQQSGLKSGEQFLTVLNFLRRFGFNEETSQRLARDLSDKLSLAAQKETK